MKYFLLLGDEKVLLDSNLDVRERIELCDRITKDYSQYFKYTLRNNQDYISAGELVEKRLDTLATYILSACPSDEERSYDTTYKSRIRRINEANFTSFDEMQ